MMPACSHPRLRPLDAIHLAAAQRAERSLRAVVSYDAQRTARVARNRHRLFVEVVGEINGGAHGHIVASLHHDGSVQFTSVYCSG